jgi:hypothetical protein
MRNISSMKKTKDNSGVVLTKKTITNDELDTPQTNGGSKNPRPLSTVSSLNNHEFGYASERHDFHRAASSTSSQVVLS